MLTPKQTALITGASGGIGYELAKLFAADGYNLVLVARSADKLNNLAADLAQTYGSSVTVLAKDLSDPAASAEIWADLQARGLTVDVLINNAGFGAHGLFAQSDLAEQLQMIHLNIISLTHLTRLLLPGMLERGFGRILNVASTGAFAPGPLMAVYCATKAYVLSFSEALSEEMRGTGVSVTALCPGVTRTGFQARAQVGNMRLLQGPAMTAAEVAKMGYKSLAQKQAVRVTGFANQLLVFGLRFTPRWLTRRLSHQIMKQTNA
jgi:uncharacterized protein